MKWNNRVGGPDGTAETKKQVVGSWETHHFCIGTSRYRYTKRTLDAYEDRTEDASYTHLGKGLTLDVTW